MRTITLKISFLICSSILLAQEEAHIENYIDKTYVKTYTKTEIEHTEHIENVEYAEQGWSIDGDILSVVGQTAFNENWLEGQTADMTIGLSVSSEISYTKKRVIFDNEIAAGYGVGTARFENKDRSLRKISDILEANSLVGMKIAKESSLYYSLALNFKTQFNKGFKYKEDEFGNQVRTERTRFFSPADFKLGPGILWKKNHNISLNVSPTAGRVTFVDGDFTKVDPLDEEALEYYEHHKYYGVEANEEYLIEFGAAIRTFLKFDIVKNLSLSNTIELYSNYLEAPQNIDVDYTAGLLFEFNEFLSTRMIFKMIYDDDAIGSLQVKEGFGIGANYQF